jgi:hypothetical protein
VTEKRNDALSLMIGVVSEIKLLEARTSVHPGKLEIMTVLVFAISATYMWHDWVTFKCFQLEKSLTIILD